MTAMIFVSGDHFAVPTTNAVMQYLEARDVEATNIGTQSQDSPALLTDLIPDIVHNDCLASPWQLPEGGQ